MKILLRRLVLSAVVIFTGLIFSSCDSRHTLLEVFLQNCSETKLISFDKNAYFGHSVAISGDFALVGAQSSAYVFRRDGTAWKKEVNLLPLASSDGSSYRYYDREAGFSVALHGNIAVLGVPEIAYEPYSDVHYGRTGNGTVYVYRYNGTTWDVESQLTARINPTANVFGYSVSFDGNNIAVGDPFSGIVYLYHYDGKKWMEQASISPDEGAPDNEFGAALSVSGDILIVGAEESDLKARNAGMAYIYRFNGAIWEEEAQLFANDAFEDDRFGTAVAINNDVAVIGAPGCDVGSENSGAAYVFRYNGSSWQQEAKLRFQASAYTWFGEAVAIFENTLIIGAPYDDIGSAIVFRWSGTAWLRQEKITPTDDTFDLRFGSSVAINGNLAIIGAPIKGFADPPCYIYMPNGAAYIYTID